jgi:hypothetical protein
MGEVWPFILPFEVRCRLQRICNAAARLIGIPISADGAFGMRAARYLSFSAMLRCSLRCGSVLAAQLLSSGSSPLLA